MPTLNTDSSYYFLHRLTLGMLDVFIETPIGMRLSLTVCTKFYSPMNKQQFVREEIQLDNITGGVEKMSRLGGCQ
jgi:hypothetical protein